MNSAPGAALRKAKDKPCGHQSKRLWARKKRSECERVSERHLEGKRCFIETQKFKEKLSERESVVLSTQIRPVRKCIAFIDPFACEIRTD